MKAFLTIFFIVQCTWPLMAQQGSNFSVFLDDLPDAPAIRQAIDWIEFEDSIHLADVRVYALSGEAAWVLEGDNKRDTLQMPADLGFDKQVQRLQVGLMRCAHQRGIRPNVVIKPQKGLPTALQSVQDPYGLWVTSLSADGFLNRSAFKDDNPEIGKLHSQGISGNFSFGSSIWRIQPKNRLQASVFYALDYLGSAVKDTGSMSPFNEEKTVARHKNSSIQFGYARCMGKHFAWGTNAALGYSNSYFKVERQGFVNQLTLFEYYLQNNIGLEYNIFSYRRFFHEFLILRYGTIPIDVSYDGGWSVPIIEDPSRWWRDLPHAFTLNGAIARKWGYGEIELSHTLDSREWATRSFIGRNIGKGVVLYVSHSATYRKLGNPQVQTTLKQTASFGINYYFGNRGINVINPRFLNRGIL